MSEAIGPGDWVEIINPTAPEPGKITQVVALHNEIIYDPCTECGDDGPGIELKIAYPGTVPNSMWCKCELRPIYRPKADLIEQLKKVPLDAE